METTFKKKVKGFTMEKLFESSDSFSVKCFKALDLPSEDEFNGSTKYTYMVTIRHSDDVNFNVKKSFQHAIDIIEKPKLQLINDFKKELNADCMLHWWNYGKKTLSFKGCLKDLLKNQKIKFTIRKTETEGLYIYHFKNLNGISFTKKGTKNDFVNTAKQFIQMELVRMGDKSQLYIYDNNCYRPLVTVNF